MDLLERLSARLNQWTAWLAGGALVSMMLISVINIVLRIVSRPFGGTTEMVGWLAALTAAFALGYTQMNKGHVAIDLLVSRFSHRTRAVLDSMISFIILALAVLAARQLTVHAGNLWQRGSLSETMHIAYFPFTYVVAFSFLFLALTLLVDGIKSLVEAVKK